MTYTPFIWPLFLAAIILGGLALYARRYRGTYAAAHFKLLMWLGVGTAVIYLHEISIVTLPFKIFLSEARYLPLALISPALFVLSLDYIGQSHRISQRRWLWLFVVPAITILLSLTGNFHQLFRYDFQLNTTTLVPALLFEHGPWWDFYYLYSLALVIGACGVFLSSLRRPDIQRLNTLAMILGILIPISTDLLYVLRLTPLRGFYWTPTTFVFTGALFGWALLRGHLFELTPIARNTVLENISDLALVLDLQGRLVDFNRSARLACRLTSHSVGLPLLQALPPEWAPVFQQQAAQNASRLPEAPAPADRKAEIQIGAGAGQRFYELTVSPVANLQQRQQGKLFLFHDITAHKQTETQLQQSQERLRSQLDHLLSPDYDMQATELQHILDSEAIQALLDDFYQLTHIPVAIADLQGQLLVATGWQDICLKFHRQHPETLKRCLKSDTQLSRLVKPGAYQAYKCQNHLWDIVTPIMVGERHAGNLYLGQFFYDDETIDTGLFVRQAEQFGFNKAEYLAALARVPRLSREKVDRALGFYTRFAALVSQLSYSNLTLAKMLVNEEKTQADLRESEHRYRLLAENVRDVIWTMDKDYKFTYISPSIRQLRGLEPEQALQESLEETMTPASFQTVIKARQAAVAAEAAGNYEGVTRMELQQKCQDGSLVWVDVQVQDLYDEQGQCIGKFGVSRDISQRKQTELALAAEQALLQDLMDNLPDQVYFKDLESRFIRINKAQAALFGLSNPDQAKGKTDFDFFAEAHASLAFADEQRIIQTGEPLVNKEEQEQWLDHPDTWASTTKMPLRDHAGNITGTFGVSRDITARKQAEQALAAEQALLQELLDNLPDTIYFKDLESRFIRVNRAQALRLGITDPAQALGKTDFDFFAEAHASLAFADEQRIIQSGQPLINYDEREQWLNRRPDTWVSSTKMPRRDHAGKITGTFGVSRDITAQKQAEQQLKDALAQKEILLKEIHHRVKNNLAVISSLLDMQATASQDERLRSAFQDSQRRILSMARIHEQLYQSQDLEHIDMHRYLSAFTVDLLSYDLLSKTRVRVDVHNVVLGIDQAIPCGLIINELVTNALKYAFSGQNGNRGESWQPDILVSMRCTPVGQASSLSSVPSAKPAPPPVGQASSMSGAQPAAQANRLCYKGDICLIVSDNGVGLPPELDLARPQRLGLRLVTRLTGQLQGRLEMKSSTESGTTFIIIFPTPI